MMNINFDPTYDDYILNKIYDRITDFSVNSVYLEINKEKFEEIINKNFTGLDAYEKTEHLYSKSTNNLEPYTTRALMSKEFAVVYSITNHNEKSETEKNFDYEKEGIWTASGFTFYFDNKNAPKIKTIIAELKDNIRTQEIKNRFYTIGADSVGFVLNAEKVNVMSLDVSLNYGTKFAAIHDDIYDALKTQFSGLLLLHGEPGTGKCITEDTYVTVKNKKTDEISEITIKEFNKLLQ